VAGERLLAGKISNTMFLGPDELYDVDGVRVQPNVMMWTFLRVVGTRYILPFNPVPKLYLLG
jgi:hypothetical protein